VIPAIELNSSLARVGPAFVGAVAEPCAEASVHHNPQGIASAQTLVALADNIGVHLREPGKIERGFQREVRAAHVETLWFIEREELPPAIEYHRVLGELGFFRRNQFEAGNLVGKSLVELPPGDESVLCISI